MTLKFIWKYKRSRMETMLKKEEILEDLYFLTFFKNWNIIALQQLCCVSFCTFSDFETHYWRVTVET